MGERRRSEDRWLAEVGVNIAHDRERVEPNERPPFGCVLLIFDYAAAREVAA